MLTRGRNSQRSFAEPANPMLPALLLLGHLVLDDADDDHQNRAAHAAATDVGKNTLKIHPAAAVPMTEWRIVPPNPPPRIPAIEFPAVPRLFSFIAAPATLPPTAPLTASMIKLVISICIFLVYFFCVGPIAAL
jgi:hypothetical protein